MREPVAIAGSAVFFLIAPGVVAGLVPWMLTDWHNQSGSGWQPLHLVGTILILVGLTVLVGAFVRFVREGLGTPAPVAPTERLVVGGAYRYVRNPMYLAVLAIIVGQAMALDRTVLLYYAAMVFAAVFAFVHGYEEPTLSRRFGAAYEAYRRNVPAWLPRLRPWRPDEIHDRRR